MIRKKLNEKLKNCIESFSEKLKSKNETIKKMTPFSVLCSGANMNGDMSIDGDIRIDGKLKGCLMCTGKVNVGYSGSVDGDITGKIVIISGVVNSNIVADVVVIKQNANFCGSINTKKIVVDDGASVNMTCITKQK